MSQESATVESATVPRCDLRALKDFVSVQKDILMIVAKDNCAMCDYLEKQPLAKFLSEEQGNFAVAQVVLLEGDEECNRIADELKVQAVPTVITFKGGAELERASPSGNLEGDVQLLRGMVKKIREGTLNPTEGS